MTKTEELTPNIDVHRGASESVLTSENGEMEHLPFFCGMPFQHICVGTEATAKICCMANGLVSENGVPMSLYANSFEEIWNSKYMREIRRKFLKAEHVSECEACRINEAATATSQRLTIGLMPLNEPLDLELLRKECADNEYKIKEFPGYIKLELGNLCNLKCRMCSGANSSEIERDPVHSIWAGGSTSMHAIWDGDRAIIGPEPRIGVTGSGVYERENIESDWFNWTNGDARFDVPITTDVELDTLVIGLSQLNRFERSCRILVNDQIGFEGRVDPSSAQIPISLKGLRPTDRLTINIFSDAVVNSQTSRKEGVPVTWIALQKSPSPISNPVKKVIGSRLSRPGLWYNNKELVFEELLANPEKLRRFYVTGGEPMIEPRFVSIIDFFVERGVAGNIALELTTNCTVVNKRLLSQFKEFKSLLLTVSLDGIEEVQEYMRYPSRWEIIKRNIHILRETGFAIIAVPVVQAYNMLSLVDIAKFSRQVGIEVSFMNNLCWPAHLATGVMPKNVHELAARRLREYARKIEDDRSAICMHGQISSLADMFEGFDGPADHAALRTFNLFTNDLDLSRGQNFKKSLPELYNLILESGYEWTESALHAHSQFERRPSRERVHQWV